ncbi:hypothetical protein OQ519_00185 [Pseudomonas lurida]|uniref:hypothetical protein n=1 Tax=Pseudomonas TaxID=286 RepID=UPI0005A4D770|nr:MULTISPECIES: hypothetical protein [Pseudomonas]KGS11889.1 hypothetical protein OA77_24760 [Pseudomonas coronafaciens]MBD8666376.1 hypothetical protein [Pseudomonas lurida]MCK0547741.1 hypothetical protein [Pseudomonas syringae pv. aptata]RMV07250.1 hypothetical protein ALP20_00028 [Pseudomonas coronafaciens pv. coronafaciens]UZQ74787.1 hypothetical protein OQ519_00185 [Pseudomonas lurida]
MKIAIKAKIAVGASLVFSIFAAVAFSTAVILKGATPSVQAFMYQSSLLLTSCGADDAHRISERESTV